MVPWSCLFLLHVHGLCARCYGLWASQGRELSTELIARSPLILPLSPSYFHNCRAAHVPHCFLWRRPSLRSLPKRATGSALCVMGGRQRLLGYACSSYTCMGSGCIRRFITIADFSPEFIYLCVMYYPFYMFVLQDHRPGDRITWCSGFLTDQQVIRSPGR